MIAAIVCFGIAILFGLMMLMHVLTRKRIPRALAFTHGPFALAGIILLSLYSVSHDYIFLTVIVLFILAALGGLTMFYKDITGKTFPPAFVLGHGALAFTAFIILVIMTVVSTQ